MIRTTPELEAEISRLVELSQTHPDSQIRQGILHGLEHAIRWTNGEKGIRSPSEIIAMADKMFDFMENLTKEKE